MSSIQNPSFPSKNCGRFNTVIAGAFAGATSAVVAQPFDRIKTSAQLSNPPKKIITVIKDIMRSRNLIGLFDGMPPSVIAATIHRTTKFTTQSYVSSYVKTKTENTEIINASSGFIAGIIQGTVASPFEVIKIQRMKENSHFKNSYEAYTHIKRAYGLKGLVHGIGDSIARDAVWNTCYFTLTPIIQEKISQLRHEEKASTSTQLISGGIGGTISSIFSVMIDSEKSNMQSNLNTPYTSLLNRLHNTYSQLGIKGLFRGLTPKLLSVAPAGATMWFVNNKVKQYLDDSNPCDRTYRAYRQIEENAKKLSDAEWAAICRP